MKNDNNKLEYLATKTYKSMLMSVENGSLLTESENEEIVKVLSNIGTKEDVTLNGKKRIMFAVKVANLLYHNGHEIVSDDIYDSAYNMYLELGYPELIGAQPIELSEATKVHTGVPEDIDADIIKQAKQMENENRTKKHNKLIKQVFNSTSKAHGIYTADHEKSLEKFINSVPRDKFTVVLSEKFDGISLGTVSSDDGLIKTVRTRGNKDKSLDISHIFNESKLEYADGEAYTLEAPVKHEMIFTKDNFEKYKESKGTELKTRRNSISGFILDKEAKSYVEHITLVPLDIKVEGMSREDRIDLVSKLKNAPTFTKINGTKEEILVAIEKYATELESRRDSLDYDIDGIVIEVLDEDLREEMGSMENEWKNVFEIALKFAAKFAKTTLREVYYTVGKNGRVTPMGVFDKVSIDNVDYDEGTLSSNNTIKKLELRIGDEILVKRQGDVIPYITKDDKIKLEKGAGEMVEFPKQCPSCGQLLDTSNDVIVKCINESCPSKSVAKAINFLKVLNCDGVSDESVNAIYEKQSFDNLTEFVTILKEDKELLLEVIKEDKTNKVNAWLERMVNEETSLINFLVSLSINGVGNVTATKLAMKEFDPRDIFSNDTVLLEVLGPITYASVSAILHVRAIEIQELAMMFNIDYSIPTEPSDDGTYRVATTGFTANEDLKKKFDNLSYMNTVTGMTDLLVYKSETSNKYKKAMVQGIPVIAYDEFMKMDKVRIVEIIEKGRDSNSVEAL